ncbi:MAG: nucleotidyltransferase domain-containing protein [Deltaproteobacteria bacterium]|nr:nucleotidyltransferase domain-containing protein [Candidatus Tharpella aukensis]
MTKSDIIQFLRMHKEELYEKYGLIKIGLFGSYAQGCFTNESDIDLYAEFKEKKFRHIAGAWNYLEENLGKKVDLFYPHKNMRQSLKESIEKEIIYG